MENQSQGTAPNKIRVSTPLFDVQMALSARLNQTVLFGVHYGVAMMKKKNLIASGVLKRQIWIVKHNEQPKTIVRK